MLRGGHQPQASQASQHPPAAWWSKGEDPSGKTDGAMDDGFIMT